MGRDGTCELGSLYLGEFGGDGSVILGGSGSEFLNVGNEYNGSGSSFFDLNSLNENFSSSLRTSPFLPKRGSSLQV